MKIQFEAEVNLEAMKAEDSLSGWIDYCVDDLYVDRHDLSEGTEEEQWTKVAIHLVASHLNGEDQTGWVTSSSSQVMDEESIEDHRKQGL